VNHRFARLALATAAVVLVALPLAAATTPNTFPNCHNWRAIAKYLSLSSSQVQQTGVLLAAEKAAIEPIKAQIEPLHDQILALLNGTNPDPCAIGALRIQIHGLYDQIEAAHATFKTAFEALLSPDQLTKWQALETVCAPTADSDGDFDGD
jgi:hypothetical protein